MAYFFQNTATGLVLWGAALTVLFICGLIYFVRGRENPNKNEKLIMYGFSGLLISVSISRIFFILTQIVNFELFYVKGEVLYSEDPSVYLPFLILVKLYYIFFILAPVFLIYPFEKVIGRTKYILTGINSVFIIIIIVSTHEFLNVWFGIMFYTSLLIGFIVITRLVKLAENEFKALTSLLLIGFMLIISGFILYNGTLFLINRVLYNLPPILVIIGSFIVITPVIVNLKNLLNYQKMWLLLGLIPIILSVFIVIVFIINIEFLSIQILINSLIILIFLSFAYYQVIKITLKKQDIFSKIPFNVLDMFTKPPTFSEEDAKFNKENQLCLVCKSPIQGYMYVCANCKALYCIKCSLSLSEIENKCWVCDTPIDESKPVKDIEFNKHSFEELSGIKKMKFFSNQKKLKKLFDENLSKEELRLIKEMKFTILLTDQLKKIEKFGMSKNKRINFLKELLYFTPAERERIIKEISEMNNLKSEEI